MAEVKADHKVEDGENYSMGNNVDPKNVQELTQYVSSHLLVSLSLIVTCFNSSHDKNS